MKLAQILVGAALFATVADISAAAAGTYGNGRHQAMRGAHHRVGSGDITVRKSAAREPVDTTPDAFRGPAAIITAPVYVAGTFVSLPFRAFEVVFPPRANDPRVLIGAPVHFVGQVAEFPFTAVNGAFGVRSPYPAYN